MPFGSHPGVARMPAGGRRGAVHLPNDTVCQTASDTVIHRAVVKRFLFDQAVPGGSECDWHEPGLTTERRGSAVKPARDPGGAGSAELHADVGIRTRAEGLEGPSPSQLDHVRGRPREEDALLNHAAPDARRVGRPIQDLESASRSAILKRHHPVDGPIPEEPVWPVAT